MANSPPLMRWNYIVSGWLGQFPLLFLLKELLNAPPPPSFGAAQPPPKRWPNFKCRPSSLFSLLFSFFSYKRRHPSGFYVLEISETPSTGKVFMQDPSSLPRSFPFFLFTILEFFFFVPLDEDPLSLSSMRVRSDPCSISSGAFFFSPPLGSAR